MTETKLPPQLSPSAVAAPAAAADSGDLPSAPSSSQVDLLTPQEYLQQHEIPYLLDRMVKDLLVEKPSDSSKWMLRWFLEQHRLQCAEKHLHNSPNYKQRTSSIDDIADSCVPAD